MQRKDSGRSRSSRFKHYYFPIHFALENKPLGLCVPVLYSPKIFSSLHQVSVHPSEVTERIETSKPITCALYTARRKAAAALALKLSSLFAQQEDNSIFMSGNKHLRLFLSSCRPYWNSFCISENYFEEIRGYSALSMKTLFTCVLCSLAPWQREEQH